MTIERKIKDLLLIAKIPAKKQLSAERRLLDLLIPITIAGTNEKKSRARSLFDAATQRGKAKDFNDLIDGVADAARELEEAIIGLRSNGYAHSEFWLHESFGPIHAGEFERAAVIDVLESIFNAAKEAHANRNGRPTKDGDLRMVQLAKTFFDQFSTIKPSADIKNEFVEFAPAFYEIAIGRKPDGAEEPLLRQIRTVLNETR